MSKIKQQRRDAYQAHLRIRDEIIQNLKAKLEHEGPIEKPLPFKEINAIIQDKLGIHAEIELVRSEQKNKIRDKTKEIVTLCISLSERYAEQQRVAEERNLVAEKRTEVVMSKIDAALGQLQTMIASLPQDSGRKRSIHDAAQAIYAQLNTAATEYRKAPLDNAHIAGFKTACESAINEALEGDVAKAPTVLQAIKNAVLKCLNAVIGLFTSNQDRMFKTDTPVVTALKGLRDDINKGKLTTPDVEPESPRPEL
ncbi:hypothetical protein [Legionella nagasakiensis]|uniref:hypothetical protein n=1 Tax=Legionella nagasakiensis TaxID=535290 RepID=UPI00105590EC|nr:hypothetical protein [Legionella nagasakiensis]